MRNIDETVKKFRERLKELQEEKGLSQNQLSKLIGIDQTTLSRLQLGKNLPSYEMIVALSEFFGCTAGYLIGTED